MTILIGLLLLLQAVSAPAATIRVSLQSFGRDCREIVLRAEGPLTLRPLDRRETPTLATAARDCTIRATAAGVEYVIGESATRCAGRLSISAPEGAVIQVSASPRTTRSYRGTLEIRSSGPPSRVLSLVNELDLESYLSAVVPAEMPHRYQAEALKAQAVAARTYAISRRGAHAHDQADLCDGSHCQVYLGAGAEEPETTAAVEATRGIVALWRGKPIEALYCADCGGRTAESPGSPFLASVVDAPEGGAADYCAGGARHCWSFTLTAAKLKTLLAQVPKGAIGDPKSLTVAEADPSGRVRTLRVTGETGELSLAGNTFRILLGLRNLPSTRFTVTQSEAGWLLQGSGSGHGIGMCQEGANGLAGPPSNLGFESILQHYYRGIEIKSLP